MGKRFPPVFDDRESAILLAMYEVPNGTYTSYTLAWELNPKVQIGTPPAGAAFAETRAATERLIVRGLMRGERLKGADGVYFNSLKTHCEGRADGHTATGSCRTAAKRARRRC